VIIELERLSVAQEFRVRFSSHQRQTSFGQANKVEVKCVLHVDNAQALRAARACPDRSIKCVTVALEGDGATSRQVVYEADRYAAAVIAITSSGSSIGSASALAIDSVLM